MQNKKYKASVLAVTLIIMAIILASALSISAVSVRERKSSIGANKTSLAYQTADMGVEKILGILLAEIKSNPAKTLNLVGWGTGCNCENVTGYTKKMIVCSSDNYKVQLKKQDFTTTPASFVDISCDDSGEAVINVDRIKSVGTDAGKQTQRAIDAEVPVAL